MLNDYFFVRAQKTWKLYIQAKTMLMRIGKDEKTSPSFLLIPATSFSGNQVFCDTTFHPGNSK
jgi:hypothetical protein